jgi:uncharacterized protein (DUF433 family)
MGNRISIDSKICHGKPVIKGTRVLVSNILSALASGDSIDKLLKDYPNISREDIAAVLDKAKKEGKVLIKKRDGSSFILSPLPLAESPLDVKGINIDLTENEIIDVLKEVRRRK